MAKTKAARIGPDAIALSANPSASAARAVVDRLTRDLVELEASSPDLPGLNEARTKIQWLRALVEALEAQERMEALKKTRSCPDQGRKPH